MWIKSALLIFLSLHLTIAIDDVTRCDQLPRVNIDLQEVIAYSPFHVFRSLDPSYNCTTAIMTGPAPTNGIDYSLLLLQGYDLVSLVGLVPVDNATLGTKCEDGSNSAYRFLDYKMDANGTYFCNYVCDSDGAGIESLRCYGHSSADEDAIQTALDTYLAHMPQYSSVVETQADCHPTPYCQGYFY